MAAAIPSLAILLFLFIPNTNALIFSIINRCSYTVWPAVVPLGSGVQLDSGKTWTIDVPAGTTDGRLWARTGCSFHGEGKGSCQTGDCDGMLACKIIGQSPTTMAEFTIGQGQSYDFFDISLTGGFNVPMDFLPVPVQADGERGCRRGPRCAANITSQCPIELKATGGCNNECPGKNCRSSRFFKRMCPEAYSLPDDENTFTCATGTNYQVTFCPSINITTWPADAITPLRTLSIEKSYLIRRVVLVLAPAGGLILLTLLSVVILVLCKRRRRRHQDLQEQEELGELHGTPMRFTFQQLKVATEQFTYKLGEGGFGSVFKGQIGEEIIAVKRLDRSGQGKREYLAEVQTIGSSHHINLVRLIGFCAEKSHRLLVYEYMPKGSLDRWIYRRQDNNAPPLDWRTRYKISTDIAKGLSYLHEECTKRIAHLDIKPQNILLDDNFNAKVSDFGLCKLIDRDMSHVVTRMRGTPGYLAPEWLTSQITEKADVYSFGVVVMEIISGRKNLDTSRSEESVHLITLLEEKVKSDQLADLIDKDSNDMQVHKNEVIQMMKLAMWCLQIDCKRRPKMSEVVKVLEGSMNAETEIDHKFVAKSPASFGTDGNLNSSAPPLASDVSGPR